MLFFNWSVACVSDEMLIMKVFFFNRVLAVSLMESQRVTDMSLSAVMICHSCLMDVVCALQVKCWDLECNKVIRQYHGHLSAVYALSIHPTLDVLVTGGRDATARVWDMRTKSCIHVLSGHTGV